MTIYKTVIALLIASTLTACVSHPSLEHPDYLVPEYEPLAVPASEERGGGAGQGGGAGPALGLSWLKHWAFPGREDAAEKGAVVGAGACTEIELILTGPAARRRPLLLLSRRADADLAFYADGHAGVLAGRTGGLPRCAGGATFGACGAGRASIAADRRAGVEGRLRSGRRASCAGKGFPTSGGRSG